MTKTTTLDTTRNTEDTNITTEAKREDTTRAVTTRADTKKDIKERKDITERDLTTTKAKDITNTEDTKNTMVMDPTTERREVMMNTRNGDTVPENTEV